MRWLWWHSFFFPSVFIGITYPALDYHYAVDPQIPALFTSGWQIARQMITAVMGNSASHALVVISLVHLWYKLVSKQAWWILSNSSPFTGDFTSTPAMWSTSSLDTLLEKKNCYNTQHPGVNSVRIFVTITGPLCRWQF